MTQVADVSLDALAGQLCVRPDYVLLCFGLLVFRGGMPSHHSHESFQLPRSQPEGADPGGIGRRLQAVTWAIHTVVRVHGSCASKPG